MHRGFEVQGVAVPSFLYGTAWKEDATAGLVEQAVEAGFRGIDTANQRKHYHEAGVGAALAALVARGAVKREDLFLQTKFTFLPGQDHRLPYDPDAPIGEQVHQSFRTSQQHLGVERVDALVLHGPSRRYGLGEADWRAWRAMEQVHDAGGTRLLGASNISLDQIAELWEGARIKPAFVQNRCFARFDWDTRVRAFCRDRDMVYQAFSLLTANLEVLRHPALREIAARHQATGAQVVFAFALAVGMLPLTGTTSAEHMKQDLAAVEIALEDDEVTQIETLGSGGQH